MPTTQPPQDRSSAGSLSKNERDNSVSGMEGLTAGAGFGGASRSGSGSSTSSRVDAVETRRAPETEPGGSSRSAAGSSGSGTPMDPPDEDTPANPALKILRRELLILAIAALVGFVLIPLAIWAVGNRILGPYTHLQDPTASTGPMRLLADFYSGLGHGSVVFWWVGFGPYVLVWLVRLIYRVIRASPATAT